MRLATAWLNEQWNKPSRTDYYLMRIAQRVHQQWNNKTVVGVDDQRVQFEMKKVVELTQEEKVARSKAIWKGGVKAAERLEERARHGN